ncbi:MAG: HNH endonuclease [Armatimonadetes bacterium]|nr:HNH endonuclease [Armatimonadota bacterium]MCX7969835.1 HNH endonuclease [Armatimonadota bacterium]MDW8143794.1 HNH endonuclease signature motif containing protein [Armatimonadota bacterium]
MKQASFRVLLTKSRLEKGLLAISRKFRSLFPPSAQKVTVFFDDESKPYQKPYTPFEAATRESRIYSLRKWFLKHKATVGDWVEVIVEKAGYRLIFRKRSEEEVRYRNELQEAETEEQATNALRKLAQTQKRSLREAAIKELRRLSKRTWERKRIVVTPGERYEVVPASLRALLKTVYEGHCQICGFTFRKRNGEPYFEVHHVDPEGGHQPQNLLVLCANCHAQMEHADVFVERDAQGWVVAVTINGERRPVYQALIKSLPTSLMLLALWSFLTLYYHATSHRI